MLYKGIVISINLGNPKQGFDRFDNSVLELSRTATNRLFRLPKLTRYSFKGKTRTHCQLQEIYG
jgi:hypothetical protein